MRTMVYGLAAAVALALGLGGWLIWERQGAPKSPASVTVDGADIGGPFQLTDHTGRRVSERDVIQGPTLVYFGYSYCPDICPLDTALMAEAVDLLAERGISATPVFVTVDPERDTPEALADFVSALHPAMIGLTGSAEDIAAVAAAYKVYYAKVDMPDSAAGYLMNHSGFTYLMMPDGIAGLFRRGFPASEIADEVARILDERGVTG